MKPVILIIDDDDALRDMTAKGLRANGFDVVRAESADVATDILARLVPDAIILDRMMPGTDGATALRAWRASGMTIPVIMLTAMGGAENTIAGLEYGADDYLAKPFQLRELVLRLNNLIKKSTAAPALPDGLTILDGEFYVDGKLLTLSASERELLSTLASPMGAAAHASPMTAKRLREKLRASHFDVLTIRGAGYKLVRK